MSTKTPNSIVPDDTYSYSVELEDEAEFNRSQQISLLTIELDFICDVVREFQSKPAYDRICDKIDHFLSKEFVPEEITIESVQSFQKFNTSIKKEFKVTRKVNKLMEPYATASL